MTDNHNLKRAGLKVTTPRLKILELLESANPHHLSAEAVHQQLKNNGDDVGLATVYRVLTQFETAGLICRHSFEGGFAVYEIEQGVHHDHLVCVRCGLVKEFYDKTIEKAQEDIAKQAGFQITDHHHTMYGLCEKCQEK